MNKNFIPNLWVPSIDDISPQELYKRGIRGIIQDIDNTLVEHGYPVADERAKKFIRSLEEAGIRICFVSNNKKARILSFNKEYNFPYIYRAMKPLGFSFRRAMRKMGTEPKETAVIGDQIFSDIWGGNMAGLYTILVNPILKSEKEGAFVAFKRKREEKVLLMLKEMHHS